MSKDYIEETFEIYSEFVELIHFLIEEKGYTLK